MATIPDTVMDKDLDEIALSDRAFLCSQEPATYNEAATTYNLATINLAPGDWSKSNGVVSGRKLTIAEKTGTGTNPGTATHVAFAVAGSPGTIKFISNLTSFIIGAGVGFVMASKNVLEIRDPA